MYLQSLAAIFVNRQYIVFLLRSSMNLALDSLELRLSIDLSCISRVQITVSRWHIIILVLIPHQCASVSFSALKPLHQSNAPVSDRNGGCADVQWTGASPETTPRKPDKDNNGS